MANNPLAMSDEDFLKQNGPEEGPSAEGDDASKATDEAKTGNEGGDGNNGDAGAAATGQEQQQQADDSQKDGQQGQEDQGQEGKTQEEKPEDKSGKTEEKPENKDGSEGAPPSGSEAEAKPGEQKPGEKDGKPAAGEEGKEAKPEDQAKAPDYEGFYKQIMTPFTANGKKIELKDPSEAIALMQMGANYTRKLQEMAPNRKILAMLGNHNLLDESKLSFFIALDKGDPEAIKKLIVDKGIDPLDIDTKIEPAYREGSYGVSDEEVAFRTQVEELSSNDEGKQTLQAITDEWDQASKDLLWQHPEVMSIIHSQRENGIYSRISEEMNRQRTLGKIAPTTSFLEAYKVIGDQMHASGAFADLQQGGSPGAAATTAASAEKPASEVLATRAEEPRPIVDNGDKAGAASPSRAAPGKAKEVTNFLAMSDDDFLKSDAFKGRV